jgi:hypothetical protein
VGSSVPALLVACVSGACVLALAGEGTSRGAAPGDEEKRGTAKLACAPASEPGRVRCEVEVRVPAGVVIKWADLVVTKTPPFATALRARVGPTEASAREETVWRWAIALAARARGAGALAAKIRLVSCVGDACVTSELGAEGSVVVGE